MDSILEKPPVTGQILGRQNAQDGGITQVFINTLINSSVVKKLVDHGPVCTQR